MSRSPIGIHRRTAGFLLFVFFGGMWPVRAEENSVSLRALLNKDNTFYASQEAWSIAESVMVLQRANGAWPKNVAIPATIDERQRAAFLKDREKHDGTFDNSATHTEMRFLSRVWRARNEPPLLTSLSRGLECMLAAQMSNGGWPQSPNPRGYGRHITYNDGAMIGVMEFLRDVVVRPDEFSWATDTQRARCRGALIRGIECILNTQITINGKKTAWCAQHDEKSLRPVAARSYELPSISGSESVGIVRFLMSLERPDARVSEAVHAAVAWFEDARMLGVRVVKKEVPGAPGGKDTVLENDPKAPPLWARFYSLESGKPFFCSRDGVPRDNLADISHERRNGYSWLGSYAANLLAKEFPAWKAKHEPGTK